VRLQSLLESVRPLYEPNDPGHDLSHALRVANLCERIVADEGGDLGILLPAALCHDAHRWEYASHSEAMAELLSNLLLGVGYSPSEVEAIIRTVQRHSFHSPQLPETLEEKILFDADKLEGLGATGIGRCFAVSGKLNQPIFEVVSGEVSAQNLLTSVMGEYWQRLHTETARALGKERHSFLLRFIAQLQSELRAATQSINSSPS
jgi:uncharacterized protein